MDRISDLELLHGFARGEPERVEEFTELFYPKVRSLIFKLVSDEDESKDLTQEVFIILFEKYKSYRNEASLQTWVMKITYNLCINYLNKRGRLTYSIDEAHSNFTDTNDSWELKEEQWKLLENALSGLNPDDQIYIDLFYLNECSVKEISNILGKSESAVKTRLSRVRSKLMELVNYRYGEI